MTATRELLELQSIDIEIEQQRARLAEIAPLLGDDSALRTLAEQASSSRNTLDNALARQKELDDAIADYTAKIETAEARLYSGSVKNPRELQNLQADVNMLKRHRAEQEDNLILVLDEVEEARRDRDLLSRQLQSTTADWKANQQSMIEEQTRLRRESVELDLRRNHVVSRIPSPEVALYDRARRQRPNHPVARLRGDVCDACRVGVPTRMALEIRAAANLATCPNCGRILLPPE